MNSVNSKQASGILRQHNIWYGAGALVCSTLAAVACGGGGDDASSAGTGGTMAATGGRRPMGGAGGSGGAGATGGSGGGVVGPDLTDVTTFTKADCTTTPMVTAASGVASVGVATFTSDLAGAERAIIQFGDSPSY